MYTFGIARLFVSAFYALLAYKLKDIKASHREADMKNFFCMFCLFIASGSDAKLFVPSIEAVGADADTEAVVPGSVEPASRLMIDFTLTNPNSSNTVLLAFGKDLNADGELSAEEIKYCANCQIMIVSKT
jgi:hypothetical protein